MNNKQTKRVMIWYGIWMMTLTIILFITFIHLVYKGRITQFSEVLAVLLLIALGISASFIAFINRNKF